jgi:hypothetical protein
MPAEINPIDQVFSQAASPSVYFETMPAALQTLNEQFGSTSPFTLYTEGTLGDFTVSNNQAVITHTAGRNTIVTVTSSSLVVPQAWVEIRVDYGGTGTGAYDNAGVGIVKDANNFLFASIDRKAGYARIQCKIGGTNNFYSTTTGQTYSPAYRFALSLVNSCAIFWKNTGGGWTRIASYNLSAVYDFRTTGNLTGWKYGFTVATPSASTWKFSDFKAGSFGTYNMRDMTIVTEEDGTPYIADNKVLFTATCNDLTLNAVQSYCGVFSLNLSTYAIAQQGVIFVQRDGKSYADLAAHIIRYSNGNRRIFISSWGNGFGGDIYIMHGLLTSGDVLSGVSLLSGLTEIELPGQSAGYGVYDPFAVKVGSDWLIAYSITEDTDFTGNPFYPALASTPDFSTFSLIGADTAMSGTGYEGTKIVRVNGNLWVLAGGPAGSGNNARIYNSAMSYIGDLDATFSGGAETQPHPMVFPAGDSFFLLTFDNNKYSTYAWTWGRPVIHLSTRYLPDDGGPMMWIF